MAQLFHEHEDLVLILQNLHENAEHGDMHMESHCWEEDIGRPWRRTDQPA